MILENNLTTVDDVTNYTKAGGGCGECNSEIEKILKDVWSVRKSEKSVKAKKLTNLQKIDVYPGDNRKTDKAAFAGRWR